MSETEASVGLCAHCAHHRLVTSDRGGTYWYCRRAETDARFPKYPILPVFECHGYDRVSDVNPREDRE